MPRLVTLASLELPPKLDQPGLLVGWSLEHQRHRPPIGFNHGDPLRTPATGYIDPILLHGEGHLMTIAPTGAGKGTGCIVPALLRYPGPVIVIDPKGENAAITARRRRELGHRVVHIDPFGLTNQVSDTLNPLDAIDITRASGVDEAASLAQALVRDMGIDTRNRYWYQRAQHLVTGVILHVLQNAAEALERGDAVTASLITVREHINRAASDPSVLQAEMSASRHPEVRRIANLLAIRADETLAGILSFAQEAVDFLRGDAIETNISRTSFPLDDVVRGDPLSIYLVLPPHLLESHSRLLKLWLGGLFTCITRRRRRPAASTLLILDEAAQLGELPQLRQAVTLLRGYGLQTWSFWQDVSQLQLLYPQDWKTMVNNCRVLQCFGALNQAAATDMANLTGFGDGLAVLDLDAGEMLLQVAGDQAVVARVPNYLTDPAFAGLFEGNPFFGAERDVMPARTAPQKLYERTPSPPSVPLLREPERSFPYSAAANGKLLELLKRKWIG